MRCFTRERKLAELLVHGDGWVEIVWVVLAVVPSNGLAAAAIASVFNLKIGPGVPFGLVRPRKKFGRGACV